MTDPETLISKYAYGLDALGRGLGTLGRRMSAVLTGTAFANDHLFEFGDMVPRQGSNRASYLAGLYFTVQP